MMNRRGFFQRLGAFVAALCCGTKAVKGDDIVPDYGTGKDLYVPGICERLDNAIAKAMLEGQERYDITIALSTEDRILFGKIFTDDPNCAMLFYAGVRIWPDSPVVRGATEDGSLLMVRNDIPCIAEYRILKDICI